MYKLLCLALLVQLATARYYKPRPPICLVTNDVQFQNETLEATLLEVVKVPMPIGQIYLNTVYQTSVLPITSIICQTVTEPGLRLEVTDVQLLHETQPLTVVRVSTLTRNLVQTELDIFTRTATNYKTNIHTLPAVATVHLTVTEVNTRPTTVIKTVPAVDYSTLTVTKAQLQTEVVSEEVQMTRVVATTTEVKVEDYIDTHTLTKMITQTICPPPISYYNFV